MSIQKALASVLARVDAAAAAAGRDPRSVTLVAATKVQSSDTIRAAIAAGVTHCGENRVQELTAHLADDAYAGARVHFIGHLQTNKVKYVVGRVELIHSVSSLRLLDAIEAQAARLGVVQQVLLEVNVGEEASKSGFAPREIPDAARYAAALPHVRLRGLMAIPPVAVEKGANLPYFVEMGQLLVDIGGILGDNVSDVNLLSMGMSDDLEDAVAAGATHIRVGTALFGARPPKPVDGPI